MTDDPDQDEVLDDQWDLDPYDDVPMKEEPDCYVCGDSGTVPGRWWSRRRGRGCPSCHGPDLLGRLNVRWFNATRWSWWVHRLRYHRRDCCTGGCTEDPPF